MDKRFKIEVAFFELMIDVGADRLLQAEVQSCLPSGLAKITADACLGRLGKVFQSKVFAFV